MDTEEECDAAQLFPPGNATELFLQSLGHFSTNYQIYHGYICVAICSFGLANNIINTIVLTRPNMRTAVNMLLAAVAICDAGTMMSYLIYILHFYVLRGAKDCRSELYSQEWMYFILFHSLWSILLHSASLWLAVMLAFLRLTVIRKTQLSHKLLRPATVWKMMAFLYVFLTVLCAPIAFTSTLKPTIMEPCGDK